MILNKGIWDTDKLCLVLDYEISGWIKTRAALYGRTLAQGMSLYGRSSFVRNGNGLVTLKEGRYEDVIENRPQEARYSRPYSGLAKWT